MDRADRGTGLAGTLAPAIVALIGVLGAVPTASAQSATVTVIKDANPNSSQDFDFDVSGTGLPSDIDLDDDTEASLPNMVTFPIAAEQLGAKTITESTVPGWTLTQINCSGDANATTSLALRQVTLDVSAGENIVCTFVNTANTTVTVVKDANPNSSQDFDFDVSGTGLPPDIDLDDDAEPSLPNTVTFPIGAGQLGVKTITESALPGWSLTQLSCTGDANATTSLALRQVSLDVSAGEHIICTFVNTAGASFHTVTPCRLIDTRGPNGPSGGPALLAGTSRTFPAAGLCGVPSTAKAIAANVAVVGPSGTGFLTLYPAEVPTPLASTINFRTGIVRTNNAVLRLGAAGQISVACGMAGAGSTHFLLDISGYFE